MAHAAHGPHSGRLGVQPDKRKLSAPHIIHQRPRARNRARGESVLFASLLLESFSIYDRHASRERAGLRGTYRTFCLMPGALERDHKLAGREVGWEAGIRTPIPRSRAACPTIERPPSIGRGGTQKPQL